MLDLHHSIQYEGWRFQWHHNEFIEQELNMIL